MCVLVVRDRGPSAARRFRDTVTVPVFVVTVGGSEKGLSQSAAALAGTEGHLYAGPYYVVCAPRVASFWCMSA